MPTEADKAYDPVAVEASWRARWDHDGTNSFTLEELRTAERPFFNLMMFPYPSAEGLHVGNIYAFTGADVFGRFKRMQGHDVFEPIGFDAFGIHSENFALKTGVHPTELIPANVANFRRQLRRIGGMFDWDHTVDTTDPDYYKWTQWLFLQLFKHGLAEQKEAPVNWCPSCMTVLANEQVVVGACERCGTGVEQRFIRQWFFRITQYAKRLLRNLKHIDWSDTTLKAQRNWIGRSDGAELHFPVAGTNDGRANAGDERGPGAQADEPRAGTLGNGTCDASTRVTVFTTRPDTVFGATYVVLAPEHPLVDAVTSDDCREEVEAYRARTSAMDLVARKKVEKHKTGVFTGGYCVNPANDEFVPIWIADYVLMGYGTGAIMAVPGHGRARLRLRHHLRPAPPPRDRGAGRGRRHPPRDRLRVPDRDPRQFGPVQRTRGGRSQEGDRCGPGRAGTRRGQGDLPPARLVYFAPAVLGPADPDHSL